MILGYTGRFFAPEYGNPSCSRRFVLPAIVGLFCVAKINKKGLNKARVEEYPINPKSGMRFDFL